MVQIRLQGTKQENTRVLEWLDTQPVKCMRTSRPYNNDRNKYGTERVYVTILLLDEKENDYGKRKKEK